jgi:glutathione synthase
VAIDVLFVCDPPETFAPRADTTLVMIAEAVRRGHRPFCTMVGDLGLRGPQAWARVSALAIEGDDEQGWHARSVGEPTPTSMASFGATLMRKDPPFDASYLAATWILDHAGAPVFNAPAGLRSLNEKLAITSFPQIVPRTVVSRDLAELRRWLAELGGKMILKPVLGYGGREILLARDDDPNLGSLLELATADGTRWTIAQEYLPAAKLGDKRILLCDGAPVGAVLRVPRSGEIRNNFHAGGSPAAAELTEEDRAICSAVGPMLRAMGQLFVGLDVIGGRLTEINVTSPTGMQEINRLGRLAGGATMQARLWDALESKLGLGAAS